MRENSKLRQYFPWTLREHLLGKARAQGAVPSATAGSTEGIEMPRLAHQLDFYS